MNFNKIEFIESQKPKEPFRDWRMYSLLIPAVFSAIGFFVFAILGYSFTEFSAISQSTRFALVVVGGICLAFGCELGTLTNTIEIWRKQKLGSANRWDWLALIVSLTTTLSTFIVAFAALLGERATWSQPVQVWGAIIIGALSALDSYGGFLETGYLFASYETRIEQWYLRLEKEQVQKATVDFHKPLNALHNRLNDLQRQIEQLQYPVATIQDFRRIVRGVNGAKAKLTSDKQGLALLEELLTNSKLKMPASVRTAQGWLERLQEGKL